MSPDRAPRILAVADSDSYVKWAAGLLDTVPSHWRTELVVVRSPIAPSPAQITAAKAGTSASVRRTPMLTERQIRRRVAADGPDVVFLASTGPVVDVLTRHTLADLRPRPVYVSGLPGISVPATERAWHYRSAADLFVVHSEREVREFSRLAQSMGIEAQVGLSTLPSLKHASGRTPRAVDRRVVFAPQALVPTTRADREQILLSLARLADNHPDVTPVVKRRTSAHEAQTHRERVSYDELWDGLVRREHVRQGAVTFDDGPMAEHLRHAVGFVTVSSTAALEAVAAGIPTIILNDFGVSKEMINIVFEGSGLLGDLDDLAAADFRTPNPAWLADNYFHPETRPDWLARLSGLVEAAHRGEMADRGSLTNDYVDARHRARAVRRLRVHPRIMRWRTRVVHQRARVMSSTRLAAFRPRR